MPGILDLLNSDAGKAIVNGVAGQTGQNTSKTNDILNMALPVMMQAMRRNASTPDGAQGLMNALNSKHDGSVLDDLEGYFGGGVNQDVLDDGGKILGHVLGSKQKNVERTLGAKSGLDAAAIGQIMQTAAPLIMGFLGKQARQSKAQDAGGLDNVLGGLLQGNSPQTETNFLNAVLDADGDGSVVDDVADMLLSGKKQKGGLGGMLGDLLGG